MKLGTRLAQIESMVAGHYDHIWDCCCDHGLLGAALLARQAAPYVHFVDIVPEITRQVEAKLARFYPSTSATARQSQWQVHCIDVAGLPLHKFHGKHLIIIAGIGGDLMIEFIKGIYQNHADSELEFLLCPVNQQFMLRQQLIQFDFSLQAEALVAENHRFYEIIWVTTKSNPHAKISAVGTEIWRCDNAEKAKNAADYLQKTLAHYERMQLNSKAEVQPVIDAYRGVKM